MISRTTTYVVLILLFDVLECAAQQELQYGMTGTWKVEGEMVRITYELFLPIDKTYDVHVVLRKEGDSLFSVVPRAVQGAIGRIHNKGGQLEILWNYKKDIEEELEGSFRFDFDVKEIVEEGGWKWWYYAAGGAAALAGTIVIVKGGVRDKTQSDLPNPPRIRP